MTISLRSFNFYSVIELTLQRALPLFVASRMKFYLWLVSLYVAPQCLEASVRGTWLIWSCSFLVFAISCLGENRIACVCPTDWTFVYTYVWWCAGQRRTVNLHLLLSTWVYLVRLVSKGRVVCPTCKASTEKRSEEMGKVQHKRNFWQNLTNWQFTCSQKSVTEADGVPCRLCSSCHTINTTHCLMAWV
jgi:hypothetical protein